MNRQRVIALALVVALVAITACDFQDADGAAKPDPEPVPSTFYGYVSTLGQEMNKPLDGVTVTLYDEDKNVVGSCITTGGKFEFTVMDYNGDNARYLTFEYSEYAVRSHPPMDENQPDDGNYIPFKLTSSKLDEEGKYALTGTPESMSPIIMAVTMGEVYGVVMGHVSGEEVGLNGAKVTLVSESGKNYAAVTDDKGYFIVKCPYGEYKLNVSCNGFHDSKDIVVTTNNGSAYSITLDAVKSDVLLGLDNAHSMMLIGFIILVLMLVITIIVARASNNPDSPITLENDLAPAKDEDETDDFNSP